MIYEYMGFKRHSEGVEEFRGIGRTFNPMQVVSVKLTARPNIQYPNAVHIQFPGHSVSNFVCIIRV